VAIHPSVVQFEGPSPGFYFGVIEAASEAKTQIGSRFKWHMAGGPVQFFPDFG
jgi:hypothetical protein